VNGFYRDLALYLLVLALSILSFHALAVWRTASVARPEPAKRADPGREIPIAPGEALQRRPYRGLV
jgi:hypothetical protein